MKFIDLFAGIGGFRIPLEDFGGECVFSSEMDKFAALTYSSNFGEIPTGDITKVDEKDIPEHDILAAGFPCQPFSISGKRLGFEDTRGTLFFNVARIVKYHKPKFVILENVRNFATHDNGNTLSVVKAAMEDLGYTVFYKVLNASHYGLPQNRERIYILCFREDLNVEHFDFPKATNEAVKLSDILDSELSESDYLINRPDIKLNYDKITLLENVTSIGKPIRVGTINKGGQGERIYSDKGHSITLSANGGGAGAKTGAYLINGKVRKLSPRECARLQGFPEEYKIVVSDNQAWKQFGNAVPVKVVREILKKVKQDVFSKDEIVTVPYGENLT